MTSMIERVAEAIYTAPIRGDIYATKWNDLREKEKDTFRDLARAAIEEIANALVGQVMENSGGSANPMMLELVAKALRGERVAFIPLPGLPKDHS